MKPGKFLRNVFLPRVDISSVVDPLEDAPRDFGINFAIQQVVGKVRKSLEVDTVPIFYYQMIRKGRLCSCFDESYDSPDLGCLTCFGTGRVGGYLKYGTVTFVLDPTYYDISLYNVVIDDMVRPYCFKLQDGRSKGFVECVFYTYNRVISLDRVFSNPVIDPSRIYLSGDDFVYYPITSSEVNYVINSNKLGIKVDLDGLNPSFFYVMVRFKVIDDMYVKSDWQRLTRVISPESLNLPNTYQTTSIYMDDTIQDVLAEDFVVNSRDGSRWKVIEVQENKPFNIPINWEVTIRRVQPFEVIYNFPI